MFDPERLLGQLSQNGLNKQKKGRRNVKNQMGLFGSRGSLGLGALGLAIAAFEHFLQQQGREQPSSARPGTGQPAPPSTPPPPPPQRAREYAPTRAQPVPPAPPAAGTQQPPATGAEGRPGPAGADDVSTADAKRTTWLIRAMIGAAAADGAIDPAERDKILDTATNSGMPREDIEFLEQELDRPRSIFELAAATTTDVMRRQMFAASLVAIDTDNAAEEQYLQSLAAALHLSAQDVADIQQQLGE